MAGKMIIDPKHYRLPIAYILERAGINSLTMLFVMVFIIVPLGAYLITKLLKRKPQISWIKLLMIIAFILFIVYETIIRRRVVKRVRFNLIPFSSYRKMNNSFSVKQIVSNILVFVPFGFLLNWTGRFSFLKALLACLAVSLCIEVMQLILHVGVFEIDDLINNAVGGSLGYLYFGLLGRLKRRFVRGVDKRMNM
jgi:glycopeptide antibiotics resistance protein